MKSRTRVNLRFPFVGLLVGLIYPFVLHLSCGSYLPAFEDVYGKCEQSISGLYLRYGLIGLFSGLVLFLLLRFFKKV